MSKDFLQLDYIVRQFQRISNEKGYVPLSQELIVEGVSRYGIQLHGGYQAICDAAGLVPHPKTTSNRKPNNDLFRKEIPELLINREVKSTVIKSKFLIAGDMHLPWVHQPTVDLFHEFNRVNQPDYVIQIGDLFDMYAHTRFAKSANLYTPKEEERLAKEYADSFWKQVCLDNPKAKKIQFLGNHDVRPVKQALDKMPSIEHFVEAYMERLFTFEGVETISNHREIKRIEGVGFHHGYLGGLGSHRDSMLENMVVGHTHTGGTAFRGIRGQTLFELNVGLMGDPSSKVMNYTPAKEDKQTLGFGYIDPHGPRFIIT